MPSMIFATPSALDADHRAGYSAAPMRHPEGKKDRKPDHISVPDPDRQD